MASTTHIPTTAMLEEFDAHEHELVLPRSWRRPMPADTARTGGWIVIDQHGHKATHDPLSGVPFTKETANQEAAASRLAGIAAHAVFRRAI
jgi:hypothetical protein